MKEFSQNNVLFLKAGERVASESYRCQSAPHEWLFPQCACRGPETALTCVKLDASQVACTMAASELHRHGAGPKRSAADGVAVLNQSLILATYWYPSRDVSGFP